MGQVNYNEDKKIYKPIISVQLIKSYNWTNRTIIRMHIEMEC